MTLFVKSKVEQKGIFISILILFGYLLNQSGRVFDLNIAINDFFLVVIVLSLVAHKRFELKSTFILYFILVSSIGLYSSFFYAPFIFNVTPSAIDTFINYLKFCIVFLYMVLGFNIAKLKYDKIIIKSFYYGGLIIGFLGVVLTTTNLHLFNSLLFFGTSRYKGLMIDPNYFAVLQVTILACLVNIKQKSKLVKITICTLLILSILISGSKTGFITLILYFIFKMLENIKNNKLSVYSIVFLLSIPLLLFINIHHYFIVILEKLTTAIPILFRLSSLVNNPIDAISSGGSGRMEIWVGSLKIIEKSPILGVGFGPFSEIMHVYTGTNAVAHNTYIQVIAEWGILLGGISLIYILVLLSKGFISNSNTMESHIVKDIVFVLFLGSFGISLNNSRLLWFFIGILIFYSMDSVKNKNRKSVAI